MIKGKLIEHGVAVILVGIAFIMLYLWLANQGNRTLSAQQQSIKEYADLPFINWNDPAQRALFKDIWLIYHDNRKSSADSLLQAIIDYTNPRTGNEVTQQEFTDHSLLKRLGRLWPMYLKFIIIYILVLIFSYYAVQTIAVWRFIKMKQHRSPYLLLLYDALTRRPVLRHWIDYRLLLTRCLKFTGLAAGKAIAYLVLFSPAYVVAYAFKTRFDTDSDLFMILLGTFSNGLMITYIQKYYAFLVNEGRKGYLQTARVKNLSQSYSTNAKDGISYKNIFRLKKEFSGHVFDHIYRNARYQYLPTLKEQASFLITGLIIIEMALNIQNHLCYDLLQNLLYMDYISVLLTCFGLFLLVKATEIVTDIIFLKETGKYENRPA